MQFDRSASIIVGNAPEGVQIQGLRIRFNIKKDAKPSANTADIEIYGLAEETRAAIKQNEDSVILSAGYTRAGGESVIFKGDISLVEHKVMPPEVVTRLNVGDGHRALRESRISLSLEPGCNVGQVCRMIAQRMFLPIDEPIPQAQERVQFSNGFSYVGPAETALRRAAAAGGMEFSIQDGRLQFNEFNKPAANKRKAVLVSAESGLIDTPEKIVKPREKLQKETKFAQWQFRSLLNPSFTPGSIIQLQSKVVSGAFKIERVTHIGDTHEGDFISECEVSDELR